MRASGRFSADLAGYALATSLACEPEVIAGSWPCAGSNAVRAGEGGESGVVTVTDPIGLPWASGFEDGFCGYTDVSGFCYADPDASYELVRSPVRSGKFAAAFRVAGDPAADGVQSRCVRQGTMPTAAYYGAWYFIPALVNTKGNWNLFHFQGGVAPVLHGLWDVSLANEDDGSLRLYVFDFLRRAPRRASDVPPVPIGSWFHIEVFWRRAADQTGRFAVYQDGELAFEIDDVETDDTEYAQWYVGNLAESLDPPGSTLFVDDVTIRTTR